MSELEQRVARAADDAWIAAVNQYGREGRSLYPRDIIKEHVLPAALKAHAEWLVEQGLEIVLSDVRKVAVPLTVIDKLSEMGADARHLLKDFRRSAHQEDQSHE